MQAPPLLLVLALTAASCAGQPVADEVMVRPPAAVTLPDGSVSAPMDLSFGKPAVEVMINGEGPFKLLVDTGASPTLILNSDLAAELGLEATGSAGVGDPLDPDAIEVQVMRVEEVRLAGARFADMPAISWDRSTLYSGEGAPRGILGFPLFRDVLVTFDYPLGEMRLHAGELREDAHTVAYDAPMGIPVVPFSVGGHTLHAHLDSGSMAALMLPMTYAERVELAGEPVEIARARTVNSEFPILAADYAGSVTLAGHEVRTEQLMFTDVMPDPNIGSQVLGQFAVTFDQKHRLVRFERTGDGPAVVKRQRGGLGLMLGKRGEEYIVSGTVEGSSAAAAGLREGDVLVAVNGEPIAGLAPGDLSVEMRRPVVRLTIERAGKRREVTLERGDD